SASPSLASFNSRGTENRSGFIVRAQGKRSCRRLRRSVDLAHARRAHFGGIERHVPRARWSELGEARESMQAPAGIRAAGNHVREQLESFESAVAEIADHLADDPQVGLAHDDGAHVSAKVRELDDAPEQCRIAPLSLIATVF